MVGEVLVILLRGPRDHDELRRDPADYEPVEDHEVPEGAYHEDDEEVGEGRDEGYLSSELGLQRPQGVDWQAERQDEEWEAEDGCGPPLLLRLWWDLRLDLLGVVRVPPDAETIMRSRYPLKRRAKSRPCVIEWFRSIVETITVYISMFKIIFSHVS